jgi:5'-nucleotidase
LDYVVPKVWNGTRPDLFVSGPHEGNNLGSFRYTLSGTIGSAYAAVERGIPGIAFSAGDKAHRGYKAVSGSNDVATLNAVASVKIVNQFAISVQSGRLLPYGYGISVNLPILNSSCSSPNYVQSRLTGGAFVGKAVLNPMTNVFTLGNDLNNPGVNACLNGDCNLPGETIVILGCSVSLSVFTIDYNAPTCNGASDFRSSFQSLAQNKNATSANGNNSNNSSSAARSTARPTATGSAPVQQSVNAAATLSPQGISTLLALLTMLLL